MNKDTEDYEVEYWDGEFAGPIYDDEQVNVVQPKRRRPQRTKLQQMEMELEYDIDEI